MCTEKARSIEDHFNLNMLQALFLYPFSTSSTRSENCYGMKAGLYHMAISSKVFVHQFNSILYSDCQIQLSVFTNACFHYIIFVYILHYLVVLPIIALTAMFRFENFH